MHSWHVTHAKVSYYVSCLVQLYCHMFHVWTYQKDILSCTHTLPLYFMYKSSIRHILSLTHVARLYYIRRTLLNSNQFWWYCWCAVCARIWDCAIFCAILYIYASWYHLYLYPTTPTSNGVPHFCIWESNQFWSVNLEFYFVLSLSKIYVMDWLGKGYI